MTRVTLNEQSQSIWQLQGLEYLRYEYPDLRSDSVVIDIGAYRGEWAKQMWIRYSCRPIVIEPGPWIVGFEYGEVINKAAATYNGLMEFGGAYYYTSSYEQKTHEYPCFDINSLLEEYEKIALVKINIEGSEYDLLERMYHGDLIKRIGNLQVQFHLVEGEESEMRYEVIAGLLSETHSLTWRCPFVWENWQRDA